MSTEQKRCEGKVRGSGGWRTGRCPCKGQPGKSFCKVHDPEIIKAKRAARDLAWNTKWTADVAARAANTEARDKWTERAKLCIAFCEGMTDEELKLNQHDEPPQIQNGN